MMASRASGGCRSRCAVQYTALTAVLTRAIAEAALYEPELGWELMYTIARMMRPPRELCQCSGPEVRSETPPRLLDDEAAYLVMSSLSATTSLAVLRCAGALLLRLYV